MTVGGAELRNDYLENKSWSWVLFQRRRPGEGVTGEWVIWDFSRDSGSLGTLSIQSGVGGGRNTTRGDIESSITLVVGH